MGWLLELLIDGIREICSQFIVDMMELVTDMFTELLSCDLSLFEELFSIVTVLYNNVIVPMGIALLLLILVWQLFKSMFGKSVNGEEPIELVIRSAISLFFLVAAKPVVDYILRIAGTPYQWVAGTEIKVESFSGYVSALEGVTETLGIGSLSIAILMLIMQFVVAWNYFKMLFVIAERYVLLGVFSYTAPLAFSTGGSKATNNILASWAKMFGGQVVLIILNAWCMKMFLSGYGNMMASSYGFSKFFAATLCLVGFCKITFKLDSYLASLGVNLGRPSAGLGAMGLVMAASRIFSRFSSGNGGEGSGSATSGDGGRDPSGPAGGSSMPESFAGPIPMREETSASMDLSDMPENEDFSQDHASTDSLNTGYSTDGEKNGTGGVFEELGIMSSGVTSDAGSNPLSRTDNGETEASRNAGYENGYVPETGQETAGNQTMEGAQAFMSMDVAGISGYPEGASGAGASLDGEGTSQNDIRILGEGQTGVWGTDAGSSESGVIGELGDYPVEEDFSDTEEDSIMELEGSSIEMENGLKAEEVSHGSAGDSFGNVGLESQGQKTPGSHMASAGTFDGTGGIIDEIGGDFDTDGIGNYSDEKQEAGSGTFNEPDRMPGQADATTLAGLGMTEGGAYAEGEADETQGQENHMGDTQDRSALHTDGQEGWEAGIGNLQNHSNSMGHAGEYDPTIKEEMEDFDTSLEDFDNEEMSHADAEGQMDHLEPAAPIPSGRDEGQADHTTSRSSWEVPRSREELKRRQQGRKGNRPVDGRPPY